MERGRVEDLTERQRQCLRLVFRGAQHKDIAIELGIAPDTVKNHLKAAMQTLAVPTRFQAARLLHEHEHAGGRAATSPERASPSQAVVDPSISAAPPSTPIELIGAAGMSPEPITTDRVHQEQVPYRAAPEPDLLDEPLRIPFVGGVRDDLKTWQIICCCVVVGALAILAMAALLKVDHEIGLTSHPPPRSDSSPK